MRQKDKDREQQDDDGLVPGSDAPGPGSLPSYKYGGIFANGFEAYRTVTDDEYGSLLLSGLIVFDTNVLLDLYRYHENTRIELLDIVTKLGNRVWIPNHAMAEFWRRRSSLLDDPKDTETALTDLARYGATYSERVVQWARRVGLPEDSVSDLTDPLNSAFDAVTKRIRELGTDETLKEAADTAKDPIVTRLETVLEGCVGNPLEVDVRREAVQDARQRFSDKRPPGYKDSGKGENYAGDYLIWLETLREAKQRAVDVLFVTDDRKEDWWYIEKGQIKGPHPELVREMSETAGVRLFMLSPGSLLHHAGKALQVKVSPESVQDVTRVSELMLSSFNVHSTRASLHQAASRLVNAMAGLDNASPGTRTSGCLSNPVAQLRNALGQNDAEAILNAAFSVLESADNIPIFSGDGPWKASDWEKDVWTAVHTLHIEVVQAWLENLADEHMESHPDNPDRPIISALPPIVLTASVQAIAWDDDGVGQVEFSAALRDGRVITTTRVAVPPVRSRHPS